MYINGIKIWSGRQRDVAGGLRARMRYSDVRAEVPPPLSREPPRGMAVGERRGGKFDQRLYDVKKNGTSTSVLFFLSM